jgi:hypothetical protein
MEYEQVSIFHDLETRLSGNGPEGWHNRRSSKSIGAPAVSMPCTPQHMPVLSSSCS